VTRLAFVRLCTFVCLMLIPRLIEAQVAFEPRALREQPRELKDTDGCVKLVPNPVGELNKRFHTADWTETQKIAKQILEKAGCAATAGSPEARAYDFRSSFVSVAWIGVDALGTYSLHRVLVHQPSGPPWDFTLPGVERYYEVFVSPFEKAVIASVLTSTEQPDTTFEQLPAIAEKLLPALFAAVTGGIGGTVGRAALGRTAKLDEEVGKPKAWVTPFEIDLPDKRAAVAVSSVADEPISREEFAAEARKFALKTGFQYSSCAHELAVAEESVLVDTATLDTCQTSTRAECLSLIDQGFRNAADRLPAACKGADRAVIAVDDAFRKFATANLAREVTTAQTFTNAPYDRYSFGLMEGLAVKVWLDDPRVKLDDDDGTIRADPLPRLATIVTINGSFKGYRRSALAVTRAERWRWFAGGAITPDFGLAGGISFLPVRGLALNAGVLLLFYKTAPANAIGKTPADASDPFGLGTARGLILGAAYNFK